MFTADWRTGKSETAFSIKPKVFIITLATIIMSGCAGDNDQDFVPIDINRSHISTNMVELNQQPSKHGLNYNKISGDATEIADFIGDDSMARVLLLKAGAGRAFEFKFMGGSRTTFIEDTFKNTPIGWEEKREARMKNGTDYYQFFSIKGDKGRCASFERQWGAAYADAGNRNVSAAIGFYCREGGLDEGQVERFLDSLAFR
jgi:hypothetical protein